MYPQKEINAIKGIKYIVYKFTKVFEVRAILCQQFLIDKICENCGNIYKTFYLLLNICLFFYKSL
jgi:hypothetical protein